MSKNIAFFIVAVLLVLGGIYWYRTTHPTLSSDAGDVASPDNSAPTSASLLPASSPAPAQTPAPESKRASVVPVVQASVQQPDTNTSAVPASDSIDRNPPNGMVFAGTGHIQVYRQGDITWRINTNNGDACVLFATDHEWHKRRVWERACANS